MSRHQAHINARKYLFLGMMLDFAAFPHWRDATQAEREHVRRTTWAVASEDAAYYAFTLSTNYLDGPAY